MCHTQGTRSSGQHARIQRTPSTFCYAHLTAGGSRFKCMVRIELDLFRKQRTSRSDRIGRSSVSKSALMAGIVTRRFSVCSFHYISVARIAVLSFITRTSDIACSTSRGGLFVSFFSPNCRRGLVEAPRPVSVSAHSRSSRCGQIVSLDGFYTSNAFHAECLDRADEWRAYSKTPVTHTLKYEYILRTHTAYS